MGDAAGVIIKAARSIEAAGADFLLICANTMHKVAGEVEAAVDIPLLHVVDATAEVIHSKGLHRIGLLGTKFTMEEEFYIDRLQRYGLDILIPDEKSRNSIHQIIFEELCLGIITSESKELYKTIIDDLMEAGAEGIILGCTEISLLIHDEDAPLPLFDTTYIHAYSAVEKALSVSDTL